MHLVHTQSIDFCDACQYVKFHQFYFSVTKIKSISTLEFLYTDLWGPASEPSIDGYRYYMSFVDDFTRYCKIFPLTFKSETLDTFKHFRLLIKK